jgi:hypothetical protein
MSTRSPLLEAALTHAEQGYAVFPTVPRGKRPLVATGFKAATRDERSILHMWAQHPDANVAVACGASHIVVLDIDSKAGADPHDILGELDVAGVPLIYTGEAPEPSEKDPNSLSGVRGAHLYFRGDLMGMSKLSITGCEIRGSQHYVVAPPSVHASGVVYQGTLPPVAELPPVPDWLPAMISAPAGNASAPTIAEVITAGERNTTLASIAGSMRRRGMSAKAIAAALQVENEERCRPPLSVDEVDLIATSIARYTPNAPKTDTGDRAFQLELDTKGKPLLPPVPEVEDVAGQCRWLTIVFALNPQHPITSGARQGSFGPDCHIELFRAGKDARSIRFEPAARINDPRKLTETLNWSVLQTDGAVPAFSGPHCQAIGYVVRMLCAADKMLSDEEQAAAIVDTFMASAVEVEHPVRTHISGALRYEAAISLRREIDPFSGRPIGPVRYAQDADTGELLITVGDLADAARRHAGSSLPHGWLEARMAAIGWERGTLEGHALPGRAGLRGPRARIGVYRGFLATASEGPVSP